MRALAILPFLGLSMLTGFAAGLPGMHGNQDGMISTEYGGKRTNESPDKRLEITDCSTYRCSVGEIASPSPDGGCICLLPAGFGGNDSFGKLPGVTDCSSFHCDVGEIASPSPDGGCICLLPAGFGGNNTDQPGTDMPILELEEYDNCPGCSDMECPGLMEPTCTAGGCVCQLHGDGPLIKETSKDCTNCSDMFCPGLLKPTCTAEGCVCQYQGDKFLPRREVDFKCSNVHCPLGTSAFTDAYNNCRCIGLSNSEEFFSNAVCKPCTPPLIPKIDPKTGKCVCTMPPPPEALALTISRLRVATPLDYAPTGYLNSSIWSVSITITEPAMSATATPTTFTTNYNNLKARTTDGLPPHGIDAIPAHRPDDLGVDRVQIDMTNTCVPPQGHCPYYFAAVEVNGQCLCQYTGYGQRKKRASTMENDNLNKDYDGLGDCVPAHPCSGKSEPVLFNGVCICRPVPNACVV